MTAYALDWAGLLLRWLHVIAGIAWIGTSFPFVLTDDRLTRPVDADLLAKGVDGETWAVHGGGFYHFNKYKVAPPVLPATLHWSYWESYATWLSGFALLCVLYFANASTLLVDPRVHAWWSGYAVLAALAYLVVGWVAYDGLCRALGRDADGNVGGDAKVGVAVFLFVCVATWAACQLFPARAAFLLTGAMLATWMTGNVGMVIIPGQRKVVAALRAGQAPDPNHGRRGKQRSVHNTVVTLPVVVAMLSNHYGTLLASRWNWLGLLLLMAAGALVRLFYVRRHKGVSRWELPVAAIALVAIVAWMAAPTPVDGSADAAPVPFARVEAIVDARCVACHNAASAQKGVRLDTPEQIVHWARSIHLQAVVLRTMPLDNATGMTDAERAELGRWATQPREETRGGTR